MELGLRVDGSIISREVNVWNVTRSCSGFFFFFASFFFCFYEPTKKTEIIMV